MLPLKINIFWLLNSNRFFFITNSKVKFPFQLHLFLCIFLNVGYIPAFFQIKGLQKKKTFINKLN